ncbi:hypothetical protein [Priestia abyssalis]|uniref:hypothetical protein n=1 Tax=Priestia abyssalis TaxID=1221450 RepID=UPI000995B1ED|nr:hypothetical protein [Priestia abyssalis]
MIERIEIENGIVYRIIEDGSMTSKSAMGAEYSLKSELTFEQVNTDVYVSGFIYKEKYDGTATPIQNSVDFIVNGNILNTFTLAPDLTGLVNVDIIFNGITVADVFLKFTEQTTGAFGRISGLGGY